MIFTRPELKIIVYCARVEIDQHKIDHIKALLQQNIDWNYLLVKAKFHKVVPLLYINLVKIASESVPQDILNQLKQFVQAKTRRNLHLLKELNELINIFQKNNVPAIPYKGLILAADIYGDLSLRQFVDLDFLVSRQDYLKVQKLLACYGYSPPPQNNVDWERTFVHPQKQIAVDLHQGLTPPELPFHIYFSKFWHRLKTVSVAGIEFKSFSSEDLLIVLCVQLAKDSQWTAETLIKVCDIAELLRVCTDIDWHFVWQQCNKLGTKRILLFSLYVTHHILEAKLPQFIANEMQKDSIAKEAALQVCNTLFDRSDKCFMERIYTERIFLRKLARERWQDKISHFLSVVFIPGQEEFETVPLPKSFFFVYHFVRPLRLCFKFLKSI